MHFCYQQELNFNSSNSESSQEDQQFIQEMIVAKRDTTENYYIRVSCGENSDPQELLKHFSILNELKRSSQFTTLGPSKSANFSVKKDSFFLMQVGPSIDSCIKEMTSIHLKLEAIKSLIYAVYSIHDNDMIHNQLTPSNLLYLENSQHQRFVLQCFPFLSPCPCQQSINQQRYSFGQIHSFTAPEIRMLLSDKKSKITDPFKSDIFSLGCIIFYILTQGSSPFISSASPYDYVYRTALEQPDTYIQNIIKIVMKSLQTDNILFQQEKEVIEMSKGFVELIASCLLPTPHDRPTTNALFHHPFLSLYG